MLSKQNAAISTEEKIHWLIDEIRAIHQVAFGLGYDFTAHILGMAVLELADIASGAAPSRMIMPETKVPLALAG